MKKKYFAMVASIFLTLSYTPAIAGTLAQWQFPNNSTPVLAPVEGQDLPIELAVVNTETWLVSLLDLRKPGVRGATCYEGQVPDQITDGAPLKINDKFVKFKYVCMGTVGVMQPSSEKGKKYLNELALSGKEIIIYLGDNQKLTFPESDVGLMKAKALEAKTAM